MAEAATGYHHARLVQTAYGSDGRQLSLLLRAERKRQRLWVQRISDRSAQVDVVVITHGARQIAVERRDGEAPDAALEQHLVQRGDGLLTAFSGEDMGHSGDCFELLRSRRLRCRLPWLDLVHFWV